MDVILWLTTLVAGIIVVSCLVKVVVAVVEKTTGCNVVMVVVVNCSSSKYVEVEVTVAVLRIVSVM